MDALKVLTSYGCSINTRTLVAIQQVENLRYNGMRPQFALRADIPEPKHLVNEGTAAAAGCRAAARKIK